MELSVFQELQKKNTFHFLTNFLTLTLISKPEDTPFLSWLSSRSLDVITPSPLQTCWSAIHSPAGYLFQFQDYWTKSGPILLDEDELRYRLRWLCLKSQLSHNDSLPPSRLFKPWDAQNCILLFPWKLTAGSQISGTRCFQGFATENGALGEKENEIKRRRPKEQMLFSENVPSCTQESLQKEDLLAISPLV